MARVQNIDHKSTRTVNRDKKTIPRWEGVEGMIVRLSIHGLVLQIMIRRYGQHDMSLR